MMKQFGKLRKLMLKIMLSKVSYMRSIVSIIFMTFATQVCAMTCQSIIGEIQIVQNTAEAKQWLNDNSGSIYEFTQTYGQGSASAIFRDNYSQFLESIGCNINGKQISAKSSNVKLEKIIINREELIQLCNDNMPVPLRVTKGDLIFVNTDRGTLLYSKNECAIMQYE